jgi:hypothetical protein
MRNRTFFFYIYHLDFSHSAYQPGSTRVLNEDHAVCEYDLKPSRRANGLVALLPTEDLTFDSSTFCSGLKTEDRDIEIEY